MGCHAVFMGTGNIGRWKCALIFALAPGLLAQTCPPGEVRVFIKDSQEAPIYDAQVRIGSSTQEIGVKPTQTSGIADFQNVPCGTWVVRASKTGFDDAESTVQITASATVQANLVLAPRMVVSSVEVKEEAPRVEQTASPTTQLHPAEVKSLPINPASVAETLPLVPGVVRAPGGELKIDGAGEERSTLVVNQTDVTDPATGKFGQTLPVDSVESVNVLQSPFLAQYGRFTRTVVAVETRRGGDKWHADLNDPFPDFRIRSYHMIGIRNETPRASLGGPLIANRLYFQTGATYILDKVPNRTLGFPHNESKQESLNSFTQFDFIISPRQLLTATMHVSPQHINFVNPDFFNPQEVTPSYSQHNYEGTVGHHFGILGGTLDSSLSVQRFQAEVGSQGSNDMVMTPTGNRGNYFGGQNREAERREWLEIWSPAPMNALGTHLFKIGSSFTWSSDDGQFTYQPVDVRNLAGRLSQRIDYLNGPIYSRHDFELTSYGQDHWNLTPKLSVDYGIRVEHQRLAQSFRIAPRTGLAWLPFAGERTVFRLGYGQFYDHIPLDVYTFSRYPTRTITFYNPDGSIDGEPQTVANVIGSLTGPRSFLVNGQRVAGAFSPRGATWNAQVEHRFSRLLQFRAVYLGHKSVGLIVLEPGVLGTSNEIVLNGDGTARYHQLEFTGRLTLNESEQLVFSYARSRARSSLNEFDNFLGNFPLAMIRPNLYSNTPGDIPNRFLVWGRLNTRVWQLRLLPIVEYRSGFPYAIYNEEQQYAALPYTDRTRFPNFFSADARVMRDFKVTPKYTVRLSLSAFNLANHFNALAVHNNTADPQYQVFFGNYHRRYRFDFEFVF
jgi:hypothetical protein